MLYIEASQINSNGGIVYWICYCEELKKEI